jgi:hypothetical protein
MDRVHGLQLTSLWATLNEGRRLTDRRGTMASNPERRSASGRLGATPARRRRSCRRQNRPAVVAHQSWSYTVLRTSIFDEVFTYDIGAMLRTYLLWGGAGRLGASSASMAAGFGAPQAKSRAPACASASGETLGAANLARVAAHWCGGKLHTAARVSTIADQNSL